MGSQVALVKGNRQMGFQVDQATHFFLVPVEWGRQMGSQVALVKGNRQMGFQVDRAAHILWFWLKEVARWDLRLTKEGQEERNRKRKSKVFTWVDIKQVKQTERQVFLYKAYYAKHWGVLLRKHCKEGAFVATQFLTHVSVNFHKNPKIAKNIENKKKYVFLIYLHCFCIFSVV